MDLLTLACFVAVAEELHFRRAAQRVHLTQPALSARIRGLETHVGVRLLERDRRSVALTPAGRTFLTRARALLADADAATAEARATGRGEAATLRIGRSFIAFLEPFERALAAFRQDFPQVRVDVTQLATPSVEQALLEGHVDLGIVHPPLSRPGLTVEHLLDEPLALAVPEDHPLASLDTPESALEGERLILHPRWLGPSLHDRLLTHVREVGEVGVEPVLASAVSPLTGVAAAVAAGGGIGFVTRSLSVQPFPGVVFRPLSGAAPTLAVAAAWREGSTCELVGPFVDLCRRQARPV